MANKKTAKNANTEIVYPRIQTFHSEAPAATEVDLVGDFTQWQQKPISMQKAADGTWRATVLLSPGAHQYRFLVDGEWRDDPECSLRASNPFGGENAIRRVA
jgi:1,4-alpha-glucan branching enzyme